MNWRTSSNARSKRPTGRSKKRRGIFCSGKISEDRQLTAERSALVYLVQFGKEGRDAIHEQTVIAPDGLTVAIEHDNRGKAHDLIALCQLRVLLPYFDALRFASRKIHLHQDKIFTGVIFELRLRKNGFVELKTKTAPV